MIDYGQSEEQLAANLEAQKVIQGAVSNLRTRITSLTVSIAAQCGAATATGGIDRGKHRLDQLRELQILRQELSALEGPSTHTAYVET